MKTIHISNEKDIQQTQDTVLVLGYFDGLHRGHQALFAEARQIAAEKKLKIAVLTFPESPKLAFVRYQPDLLLHLNSPEEREQLLEAQGVDYLYLIDFTSCFAGNKAEDFFEKYVKRLKAKVVVAGFDYHFGSDKKEAEELSQYFDGQIVIVSSVNEDDKKISSTRIRQAIKEGRVAEASKLLGYPLSTRGIVVHGVYVVEVEHNGKRYKGMASVGKNVTFEGDELRFEANIFDFSRDIYGDTIKIYWLDKIRDMVKFDGIESLLNQLKSDEAIARSWKA